MPPPLILLVDDFEDALEMYAEYLTFKGYRVRMARSGAHAIEAAKVETPALIFMDLRMPSMTGTEALRVLRNDARFADVPVVALTAHALADEHRAAMRDGFDEVIAKPCLPDELAAAIERLLVAGRPTQILP